VTTENLRGRLKQPPQKKHIKEAGRIVRQHKPDPRPSTFHRKAEDHGSS